MLFSVIWILGLLVICFSGAILWFTSGIIFVAMLFGSLKKTIKPNNRNDWRVIVFHAMNTILFIVGTILLVQHYPF